MNPRAGLILDANVLIDYAVSNLSILALVVEHLRPAFVPKPVLDKVSQLKLSDCDQIGLTVIEASTEQLLEAGQRRGALSFDDRLCLILARENGWTCVTNDRALRRACQIHNVKILWGLELMIELVQKEYLERKHAIAVAEVIQQNNPHHITEEIILRFREQICNKR